MLPFPKDILLSLEHPSRYLGTEINAVPNKVPDSKGRLLRVALCFPDVYEIAHSHLGHKIIYGLLNKTPGYSCERVYAPWVDLERYLRDNRIPLASLESGIPLSEFHLLGFSLQYELGYTNILNMLDLGRVPLRAEERLNLFPLVAAGGPGASNPEPMADFFDLFFLGDAEANILSDYGLIKEAVFGAMDKKELFRELGSRIGIYVPSLFKAHYSTTCGEDYPAFRGIESPNATPFPKAAKVQSLSESYFPECQIVPFAKPVHDRVAVEIARGCSRGCRFCQAGYLYRPVRERSKDKVLALISANLNSTGHEEAAFLALSAGDHSQIASLVSNFMDSHEGERVSLSLPSLRVRSISESLASDILRVRKTGFTMAPEAGTARLRAVINKDLTEEDLFHAVELSRQLGWRTLKLYFMCGLPTETEEDLLAIASISQRLNRASKGSLNVGLAHFTPKPHTPFQWHPGSSLDEIKYRLNLVKEHGLERRIKIKYQDPGASLVEALISRGDRRMGKIIQEVFQRGARFEAWNDRFVLKLWMDALDSHKIPLYSLLHAHSPHSPLPWDHISYGVDKAFLLNELKLALEAKTSPDCRELGCLGCGVCAEGVKIDLAEPLIKEEERANNKSLSPSPKGSIGESQEKKDTKKSNKTPQQGPRGYSYLASFQKIGPAIYLGHLELMESMKRAFRRAGLKLVHSQGFHPQPKLSFLTALPLGVESLDEPLIFTLIEPSEASSIMEGMSFPEGINFTKVEPLPPGKGKPSLKGASWEFTNPTPVFSKTPDLALTLNYQDKRGRDRCFLLTDFVENLTIHSQTKVTLDILFKESGNPSPTKTVAALFALNDETQLEGRKIQTLLF
ncbi:MAG: TIGR03960 family B12-binding radical SAM protein [Deltaproteobacteria bacterium]|jgi:radical SAM family uncharacterized protein/radical SAM-linked protein|nr:TIGR03960 family B12-binding radical SAM protein [Deltaproteobacteria bacterium]